MDEKLIKKLAAEFPVLSTDAIEDVLRDLEILEKHKSEKNKKRDAICDLWIEIFGTQPGVGYNCPAGAYDFAEVVMDFARKEEQKELCSLLNRAGLLRKIK